MKHWTIQRNNGLNLQCKLVLWFYERSYFLTRCQLCPLKNRKPQTLRHQHDVRCEQTIVKHGERRRVKIQSHFPCKNNEFVSKYKSHPAFIVCLKRSNGIGSKTLSWQKHTVSMMSANAFSRCQYGGRQNTRLVKTWWNDIHIRRRLIRWRLAACKQIQRWSKKHKHNYHFKTYEISKSCCCPWKLESLHIKN